MAEIMTATRSLKCSGTTKRSMQYVIAAKMATKRRSQPNSLRTFEGRCDTSVRYAVRSGFPGKSERTVMESWQVLNSTQPFRGPVFAVRTDRLRLPDGHEARVDVVEHAGSVSIVACPNPGELLLVRQYRHAVGAALWEIPAGSMDAGEEVAAAALRELAEETGYRAKSAREIARIHPTPGYCNELLHVVLAEDLTPGSQSLDEDERIEVRAMPIARLRGMAASGQITDAKTLLAFLWMSAGVQLLS